MKVQINKPSLYLRVNGSLQETAVGDVIEMDAESAKKGGDKWSPVKEEKKPDAKKAKA